MENALVPAHSSAPSIATRVARALARDRLPLRPLDEYALQRRVRAFSPALAFEDLDPGFLARAQESHGVDFVTALLYQRICEASAHSRFLSELRALEPDPSSFDLSGHRLLVVPSSFYNDYPEFGGDGEQAIGIARSYGMRSERLATWSIGPLDFNAGVLIRALENSPPRSQVLVSLSKGGAEVRRALELRPDLEERVAAWVNLSGVIHGSPLCDRILGFRGWKRLVTGFNLWALGGGWEFVRSHSASPSSPLGGRRMSRPFPFPVYSVFGCPLRQHLTPWTRKRFEALSRLGPNDGCTLLRDAWVPGGHLVPLWAADHYLMVPEAHVTLHRVFHHLASALAGRGAS